MKTLVGRLAVVALLLVTTGCGYALVGRGSALPPDVKTISIPLFINKSTEPNIDAIITAEVRNAFILDGRLRVYEGAGVDSELIGVIEAINILAIAFNANNEVSQYTVNLSVSITHTSNHSKKILTKQRIETTINYTVDESIIAAETLRIEAIRDASKTMVESLVSVVIEAF